MKTKQLLKLSLIISIVFCIFAIPQIVSAVTFGSYTYYISDGEAIITNFDTSVSGEITIPSTLSGYPVTAIEGYYASRKRYGAFYNCSLLTRITIPDSITYIEAGAFKNCSSLISVNIPNGVIEIGESLFRGCSSLKEITIPNTVYFIENEAFYGCSSLESINIPDSVISIGSSAFSYCSRLTSIDIPKRVTCISDNLFFGCSNLKNINIGNGVTSIGEQALFNTAFYNDKFNWNNGILYLENYLINAKSDIIDCVIRQGTILIADYAFDECTLLESIAIPVDVAFIGCFAFGNCTSLKTVYYRGTQSQWSSIDVLSNGNSELFEADIIQKFIYLFILDGNEVLTCLTSSDDIFDYDKVQKKGYTLIKLYRDKEMTQEIAKDTIFTEDTTVYGIFTINQYTYTFLNEDGSIFEQRTADYESIIELPKNIPTKENPYVFDYWYGYEDGMTLSKDITFIPKFKFAMNRFEISGTEAIEIGYAGNYTIKLATDKDIQYATIFIKYPNELILKSVISDIFVEISKESSKADGDYTTVEYLCIYSYEGESIPKETVIDALKLAFEVSTNATPKDVEIYLTEDSVLMGSEDYEFESADIHKITILPKLAEEIVINGDSNIMESGKFTANVLPDYTTDKSVIWSVDNEEIAEILEDGILTGKGNGSVTITATSKSNPEVKATKTVNLSVCAKINSLVTDGYIKGSFKPSKFEYTIYVDEDADSITLSPVYVTGTLKANGSTILSGRSKAIALTENATTIKLERTNATNLNNSTYTLTVIKSAPALSGSFEKTTTGYDFEITLNKNRIEDFEIANVLISLYDENRKLIKTEIVTASSTQSDISKTVETEKVASSYKIMLLDSLKPLCVDTEKSLN